MALVDCVLGDWGTDRRNEVHFEYATGAHNVSELRQVYDMTDICNKLVYYLGPKWDNQHWEANITGSDPLNDYWTICADGGNILDDWARSTVESDFSQLRYGTRMHIQTFDTRGDESGIGMCIYRHWWLTESIIRNWPRQIVNIVPVRGYDPNAFGLGDIIRLSAGGYIRDMLGYEQGVPVDEFGDMVPGGWTGLQRVYGYTVSWDTEGVPSTTDILTSPAD
jgi:hypothetical protein